MAFRALHRCRCRVRTPGHQGRLAARSARVANDPRSLTGFFAGFLLNFLLHARFTFSISRLDAGQSARFIAVTGINYLMTLAIVGVLHDVAGLDVVVAKVISLVPVAFNGYFLSKVWVFRQT